jgi:hypothetical protein
LGGVCPSAKDYETDVGEAGGQETEVTFIATLEDGRKLLAATDSDTYREILDGFHQ